MGHAYLFTGARGVGKTSAARILAKALNCGQGTSPTPCNQCEPCQSINSGDDIDVLEIDGASNRGIDEIRQLRQNVAVRPSRSRFKIYIIDEVHMLTKEAFNALLKTLEEPPEHVKFIFATTEPNKIPITILSRCQRYDFAGIEADDIRTRLTEIARCEGVSIDDEAVQILAMRAAGSMRDSQSLLEQLLSTGADKITSADVTGMLGIAPAARLSQLVAPLVERNAAAALQELEAAIHEGAEVSQILDQLLGYFRDVMTQAVGCDPARMLYALPGQHAQIHAVAEKLGVATVLAIVQILDQTSARLRVSSHARTLAEMALVRVCHLEDLEEVAALIRHLQETPDAGATADTVKKNAIASRTAVVPIRAPRNADTSAQLPPAGSSGSPGPATVLGSDTPGDTTAIAKGDSPAEVQDLEAGKATLDSPGRSAPKPPSQPPGAAGALTTDNIEAVWKQALDSLTGMLLDHASQADEVAIDSQSRGMLSFADAFHHDYCQRANNQTRLECALQEASGAEVSLVMQVRSRVDAADQAKKRPKSRRQQQADVAAEPFVKKAIEMFDGDPSQLRYVPPEQDD